MYVLPPFICASDKPPFAKAVRKMKRAMRLAGLKCVAFTAIWAVCVAWLPDRGLWWLLPALPALAVGGYLRSMLEVSRRWRQMIGRVFARDRKRVEARFEEVRARLISSRGNHAAQ